MNSIAKTLHELLRVYDLMKGAPPPNMLGG